MRYAILIEQTGDGTYGAYAPDLHGVGVTGESPEEVRALLKEAVAFHLEGLEADGLPIPQPTTEIDYLETPAA